MQGIHTGHQWWQHTSQWDRKHDWNDKVGEGRQEGGGGGMTEARKNQQTMGVDHWIGVTR